MIRYFAIFFLALLIPLSFSSAFGEMGDFTTDKSLYYEGDIMYISGIVSYDPAIQTVIIQISTPWNTFAHIEESNVNSDGSFSTNINIGGPLWNPYGIYLIKVFYDGMMEESIEYKKSSTTTSELNHQLEHLQLLNHQLEHLQLLNRQLNPLLLR